MLVELFDLQALPDGYQWTESGRWLKYEEDVEGVDAHRGRPHVSFLSYPSIVRLRKLFTDGVIVFDPPVYSVLQLVEFVKTLLVSDYKVEENLAAKIANLFSANRIRCSESRLHFSVARKESIVKPTARVGDTDDITKKQSTFRKRTTLQRIPTLHRMSTVDLKNDIVDSVDICAGSLMEMDKTELIMIRLLYGMHFPEVDEHIINVRFLILIVGPDHDNACRQLGRTMATLMANEKFRTVAIEMNDRKFLVDELENFLNDSVVLANTDIDNKDLLTVDSVYQAVQHQQPSRVFRRQTTVDVKATYNKQLSVVSTTPTVTGKEEEVSKEVEEPTLKDPFERTGKPFGGAINDIKSRLPYYWDDIKSALNFQCVTSILFIFFANFASAIAIGEVLSVKTDGLMGVSEILIAHGVCGVIWGLVSGQPLCIQAAVGPFMLFEESLYKFSKSAGIDFLAFRVWTAFWTFLMLIICAMVEAPFLMRYLTRFTEEIFTCLIAVIFIVEAGKFMYKEFNLHPLKELEEYCEDFSNMTHSHVANYTVESTTMWFNETVNGTVYVPEDEAVTDQPDSALLQCILLVVTFSVAYFLKKLRFSIYCGRTIRRAIGDFGVPIAVVVGTFVDQVIFYDTYTRHVNMKPKFDLTRPDARGWFVPPLGTTEAPLPNWVIPATIVPAILVTILLYAEVEIIEKLLAKKEMGLKKPSGFHWDLIVIGGLCFLCSLFGLQWMCPAAVQSLSHASSLAVMSKTAPGEAPKIDHVIEQRVTAIAVGLLHAAAAFCGVALILVPVASLFGLFLYLGVMGLLGVQIFHRFILFFVPKKYFPNEPYCQEVTSNRLHLYTIIQILCFVCLWLVNTFPSSALAFPFVLMIIGIFRMFIVTKIFTNEELTSIEGLQPKLHKHEPTAKESTVKDFYDQTAINS